MPQAPEPDPATCFRWPVRVYYEDTDAAGIVYYANYLRFFERGRTEWLRALGIDQRALAVEHGLQFVVASAQLAYLRPARLDDALVVESNVLQRGASFVLFEQRALRGDLTLTTARVKVACVDLARLRPARFPETLMRRIPVAAAVQARPDRARAAGSHRALRNDPGATAAAASQPPPTKPLEP
jgi:acyl-CoA thioester hydrolase